MPIAKFEMPDGRVARFEVPEGTTPEQANSFATEYFKQPQQQIPAETGVKRTLLNQGTQGATFGFSDEIQAALGAGVAKAFGGEATNDLSLKELYKQGLGNERRNLSAQQEERPWTSLAAQLGGGLITGGAAASTKAGATAANWAGRGGLPLRMLKGAALGAPLGALSGAGTSTEGNRLEGATTGATVGGVIGAAAPAIVQGVKSAASGTSTVWKGLTGRAADELDEAGAAIKQTSTDAYKAMRDAGATFKPETTQKIVNHIEQKLKSDGILNPKLHDKTISVVKQMREAVKSGDFGLEQLDQWRQLLGEVAGNALDKTNARKASIVIDSIDDVVRRLGKKDLISGNEQAFSALGTARSEWARSKKFSAIADIIKKSDGDANYLKRQLVSFLNNPRKTRGFSAAELSELKKAARSSVAENTFKILGKFGVDFARNGAGVGAIFGSIGSGAIAGTPGAIAAPVVGTASRYVQKGLAYGKAENLLKAIETGAKQVAAAPSVVEPVASASLNISSIPNRIKKYLKANPETADEFDMKYGKGAAESVLNEK